MTIKRCCRYSYHGLPDVRCAGNTPAKLTSILVTTTGPIKCSVCVPTSQLTPLTKPVTGKTQHRMHVLGVNDLDPHESYYALRSMRKAVTHQVGGSDEKLRNIVGMTGGRLSFITRD